jgi:hypothetical protein
MRNYRRVRSSFLDFIHRPIFYKQMWPQFLLYNLRFYLSPDEAWSYWLIWFYSSGSQSVGLVPLGGHKRSSRGVQEVCREKKLNEICIQQFSVELYLPYIYHPVVITNFITLWISFFQNLIWLRVFVDTVWSQNFYANFFFFCLLTVPSRAAAVHNLMSRYACHSLGGGGGGVN